MTTRKFSENNIAWSMKKPCDDCPFRITTPPERKGLMHTIPEMVYALTGDGQFLHSCHKTDPRVTDGGFNPNYKGPVQHCMGFALMCEKSDLRTGPMMRAIARGKLKRAQLAQTDLVHSFRELVKTMATWAKAELAKHGEPDWNE